MTTFLTAIALAIAIEGLLYAAFPDGMKRMMVKALEIPSHQLRTGGIVAAAAAILAIWLIGPG
ncbi:MAG: DUF2065 domain-containing protein [Rhodospirillales bacterium]